MKFILGKKISMEQRFRSDGSVVPVTTIAVGPCVVTQVKMAARDGYTAVQVGFSPGRGLSKSVRGHLRGLPSFRTLREFRVADASAFVAGQTISAAVFAPGDLVAVQGTSKGHGFQGVVKRHGFAGHPTSHGHKDQTRMPGSIGSKRQGPVAPGKRMAGRMGGETVTVKNLEVIDVDAVRNVLAIKGAVPGARGTLLAICAPGTMELASAVAETETQTETQKEPVAG
ncbi:50S ribosomal protein L3 [Patescibacteria group bacterium]|nr:MAG: 50S ribosomal protein L3 [Patescibacteria group bacterium]